MVNADVTPRADELELMTVKKRLATVTKSRWFKGRHTFWTLLWHSLRLCLCLESFGQILTQNMDQA